MVRDRAKQTKIQAHKESEWITKKEHQNFTIFQNFAKFSRSHGQIAKVQFILQKPKCTINNFHFSNEILSRYNEILIR